MISVKATLRAELIEVPATGKGFNHPEVLRRFELRANASAPSADCLGRVSVQGEECGTEASKPRVGDTGRILLVRLLELDVNFRYADAAADILTSIALFEAHRLAEVEEPDESDAPPRPIVLTGPRPHVDALASRFHAQPAPSNDPALEDELNRLDALAGLSPGSRFIIGPEAMPVIAGQLLNLLHGQLTSQGKSRWTGGGEEFLVEHRLPWLAWSKDQLSAQLGPRPVLKRAAPATLKAS